MEITFKLNEVEGLRHFGDGTNDTLALPEGVTVSNIGGVYKQGGRTCLFGCVSLDPSSPNFEAIRGESARILPALPAGYEPADFTLDGGSGPRFYLPVEYVPVENAPTGVRLYYYRNAASPADNGFYLDDASTDIAADLTVGVGIYLDTVSFPHV